MDTSFSDSEFYYYGRQVNQTESRTYEFKAGGILFSRDISQVTYTIVLLAINTI